MLAKPGAYVIAFVVLAGIELPFFPVTMALSIALKKVKWVAPFVTSLLDAVKICCVLLAAWLINKTGQSPSWLMFLIPRYLMVQNNLMRINRVKAGRSNVKRMLEQRGESGSYNQGTIKGMTFGLNEDTFPATSPDGSSEPVSSCGRPVSSDTRNANMLFDPARSLPCIRLGRLCAGQRQRWTH